LIATVAADSIIEVMAVAIDTLQDVITLRM
jgi:hypothetical protein